MGLVSISDADPALLQDYSERTGMAVDRCVSGAVFDWLANIAATLKRLCLPPLKVQLGRRTIELVEPRSRRLQSSQRDSHAGVGQPVVRGPTLSLVPWDRRGWGLSNGLWPE